MSFLSILISSLFLTGCFFSSTENLSEVQELKGEVFGSYYSIKFVGRADRQKLEQEIGTFFSEFNSEFSTYQKNSVVSQFNDSFPMQKVKVSPRFIFMLNKIKELHTMTEGAFDPTIGPVIKLWGFGGSKTQQTPSNSEIAKELKRVGFKNMAWDEKTNEVWKLTDGLRLDLNAFAPGWAADLLGEILEQFNVKNFLIDISGELVSKGEKAAGKPWVVGIEKPSLKHGSGVQIALKIYNQSIATSGNYRQFYNANGKKISHIIHPKTGKPVDHFVCSATVIGNNGLETDAWSTALMVLGQKGIDLAEKNGLKVYLIEQQEHLKFQELISDSMKKYLRENSL